MQAKIFKARAMVWNYKNLTDAESILKEGMESNVEEGDLVHILVNVNLARLFMMELLLLVETTRLIDVVKDYFYSNTESMVIEAILFQNFGDIFSAERNVLALDYAVRWRNEKMLQKLSQV